MMNREITHMAELHDIEIRAAADGSPETEPTALTAGLRQFSPFMSHNPRPSFEPLAPGDPGDVGGDTAGPHMNLLYHGDDDDSPEASVSFQVPVTPHLNRYSHTVTGQVPSCDARRPSSLKHVTAEDINVTASPVLRGSERKSSAKISSDVYEPDILTPIKTLHFDQDSDDEVADDMLIVSGADRLKQTMKSVTSTPDPKSLEKRHKFTAKSPKDIDESPILMEDARDNNKCMLIDKMSPNFQSDIDDMEKVRGHLHNMLKLSDDTLNANKISNAQMLKESAVEKERNFARQTNGSIDLFVGMNPLSALLSDAQPGRYQSDPTLMAENSALNEALMKERYRRKHCEDHIQHLNAKMLEMQQELAVAVATDRRKDTMIEQLDRQLAKVVDGWKRREAEKEAYIVHLKNEKTQADDNLHQQQQILRRFETDLTATVNELKKERDVATSGVQQLRSQVSTLSEELTNMRTLMESERERAQILQSEWEKSRQSLEASEKETQELTAQLHQERDGWTNRETELVQQIELVTQQRDVDVNEQKLKIAAETERADKLKADLTRSEIECKTLEMEVQSHKTEVESLRVTMALAEAKHENNLRSLEVDLRAEQEQHTANKVRELHKKNEAADRATQEAHRTQLRELSEQHCAEVQRLTEQLHEKDDGLRQLQKDYEDRLMESQAEIKTLTSQKDRLQQQRSEALSKMQRLMQSQWNEALSLLGSPQKPAKSLDPSKSSCETANIDPISAWLPSVHPQTVAIKPSINETVQSLTPNEDNHPPINQSEYRSNSAPSNGDFQENLHAHFLNQNHGIFDGSDVFSPLAIMKQVEQRVDFPSLTKHQSLTILGNTNSSNFAQPLQSRSTTNVNTNAVERSRSIDGMINEDAKKSAAGCDEREAHPATKDETKSKSVHFSANDLLYSAEIPSSSTSELNYSTLSASQSANIHDFRQGHRTMTFPVATAMRLPEQGDYLHGNKRDLSVRVDMMDPDEDEGLFSPMPDFSDDESTVAERDDDNDEGFHLHTRLLPFSPPVKQTKDSPSPPPAANCVMDDTTRLNKSYGDLSQRVDEHSQRQTELSHYIQMLLQRSPASVVEGSDQSPVRDTDHHHVINHVERNSTPQKPCPKTSKTNLLTDDKLAELSRLLNAYREQGPDSMAQEHVSPKALEVMAAIKDIQESRTSQQTQQSSPKTKPIPPRHLAHLNQRGGGGARKVSASRPTGAAQKDNLVGRESDDRKTSTRLKPARKSTSGTARQTVQNKSTSAWK